MTKKTKKVKVSRKKWLRGGTDSYLVNSDGCMCCLGFAANQISRITKEDMNMAVTPEEVYQKESFLTEPRSTNAWGGKSIRDNRFAHRAMIINDNPTISDKMRESRLKRLFKSNGVELTFVD